MSGLTETLTVDVSSGHDVVGVYANMFVALRKGVKDFSTRKIVQSSRNLMLRLASAGDHLPWTVSSSQCAPQPSRLASVCMIV